MSRLTRETIADMIEDTRHLESISSTPLHIKDRCLLDLADRVTELERFNGHHIEILEDRDFQITEARSRGKRLTDENTELKQLLSSLFTMWLVESGTNNQEALDHFYNKYSETWRDDDVQTIQKIALLLNHKEEN